MVKSFIHLTIQLHLLQDFTDGKAKTMRIDGTLTNHKGSLKSSMKSSIVTRLCWFLEPPSWIMVWWESFICLVSFGFLLESALFQIFSWKLLKSWFLKQRNLNFLIKKLRKNTSLRSMSGTKQLLILLWWLLDHQLLKSFCQFSQQLEIYMLNHQFLELQPL